MYAKRQRKDGEGNMMDYSRFYDIASYLNEINRNTFSHREVAENAHIYACNFEWSKENGKISFVIKELAKLLAEDSSEECHDWLYDMAWELKLLDAHGYDATNEYLLSKFITE
jgi:hypothetical protein